MQCSSKEIVSGGLEQMGTHNRFFCVFFFPLYVSPTLALGVLEHNLSLALLIVVIWQKYQV